MQHHRGSTAMFWAVVGMALSVPAALGLEALIHLAIPPELEALRVSARPFLTQIVWFCVPASVLCDVAAFLLQRWWQRRPPRAASPGQTSTLGQLEKLMITASLAQLPGIVAAFGRLIGSSIRPTAITVAISTIGVMCLWLALESQAAGARSGDGGGRPEEVG